MTEAWDADPDWLSPDPYDDADTAENLEPQVWLLTIYPEPDMVLPTDPPIPSESIEDALLLLPEIRHVELKVM